MKIISRKELFVRELITFVLIAIVSLVVFFL
jgi:hypothetical protein